MHFEIGMDRAGWASCLDGWVMDKVQLEWEKLMEPSRKAGKIQITQLLTQKGKLRNIIVEEERGIKCKEFGWFLFLLVLLLLTGN